GAVVVVGGSVVIVGSAAALAVGALIVTEAPESASGVHGSDAVLRACSCAWLTSGFGSELTTARAHENVQLSPLSKLASPAVVFVTGEHVSSTIWTSVAL